jgi:MCM2/3/5 family protein/Toprim domain-containing protein
MARLPDLCKETIASTLGFENWLKRFTEIERTSDAGEAQFFCVAHEHSHDTASASMNLATGLWTCFACEQKGDAIDLFFHARKCKSKGEAIRQVALELKLIADITDDMVARHHEHLMRDPALIKVARDWLGIGEPTLKHFQIGYVRQEPCSRFTLPIRGESGEWEDIRRYNRHVKPKMLPWAAGHGACRFFPIETVRERDTLFLMAGEKDMMRLWEFGVEGAMTVTGGEGSLPHSAMELLAGKTVYVCFDIDKAGREQAPRVAQRLVPHARAVYLIHLPSEGLPANGDFSDWANRGHTLEDWEALVAGAEKVECRGASFHDGEDESQPEEVTFRDIQSAQLYKRHVRFLAHAMGKSIGLEGYQVPTQVVLDCPQNQKRLCTHCALYGKTLPWEIPINYRAESSLQLFRTSDEGQNLAIRKICNINRKCEVVQIANKDRTIMQHLFLSPPIELTQMRDAYDGMITAYYHGEPIQDNRDYWFTGYVQADPKSQRTVLNLHTAEPARNAIDHFVLGNDTYEAIDWFRIKNADTVQDHMLKLHRYIEADCGIWGRYDVQQAVLESVYSALEFCCGHRSIDNGWVEVLVIGDSGTAKSTLAKRMMMMFDVGEFVSAETASMAGLVGGIEFVDKIPVTKWGVWPRNDRGFLVLDEIDELQRKHKDIISQLTALRSSGRAEITKIHSAKTPARVRTVWITNPESGRNVSSYHGACRAIQAIIPNQQDIARFTKVYAISRDTVSVETITQNRETNQIPMVRQHFNRLAILAWSLQKEQIVFTDDAYTLIERETKVIVEKYHESIPLIEKGRAFDKLAKLAVPIAVLCGSFAEKEGQLQLTVDTHHAEYAVRHLQETYDAPAMGYDRYSVKERSREEIPNTAQVERALRDVQQVPTQSLVQHLLSMQILTRMNLEDFIGERLVAAALWSALSASHCLQYAGDLKSATKTRAFIDLLEEMATLKGSETEWVKR